MLSWRAASPCNDRCQRSTSLICWPTRITGLSEVMGSWKIIAMALPRRARNAGACNCSRFWLCRKTWPPRTEIAGGNSPMMDSASRLLPEPDSPTTPSTSPLFKVMSTALRISGPSAPSPVLSCCTCSMGRALAVLIGCSPTCAGPAHHAGRRPASSGPAHSTGWPGRELR